MKSIPLTKGLFALVDDEDYELLMQWKWHATGSKYGHYAARRASRTEGGEMILMHRVINKTPHGPVTDHRDGNTLNNQKANLRTATHAQNAQNQKLQDRTMPKSSRFKGVCWDAGISKNRPWKAAIRHKGKPIFLGRFSSEVEAANAYAKKAAELFGKFHREINYV